MKLNQLPKLTARSKKRLGRGLGSGKGKTGGRGQKGQKARGKIPAANVGAGLILYKKLPYKRGWTRRGGNPTRAAKSIIVKSSQLNNLKKGTLVNLSSLIEDGIVSERQAKKTGLKILIDQPFSVALNIEIPISKKAKQSLEKVGGKIAQ